MPDLTVASTRVGTVTDGGWVRVRTVSSLTVEQLGSTAQRERRERILDMAIALAREGGFDAVQMRFVAERAEVALGTLYRYFPSKIHLLVSALGRELDRVEARLARHPVTDDTRAERVVHVLTKISRGLHDDPNLTEALTRSFLFADASVTAESHHVATTTSSIVVRAMHPDGRTPTPEDLTIARVVGDVWFSSLVSWVTGRAPASEVAAHLEVAVGLLLRD